MTTTIRTIPAKWHGNIPAVDVHIIRGQAGDPEKRWIVGEQYFANLTKAREHVIDTKKIKISKDIKELYTEAECKIASGYHHATGNKSKKRALSSKQAKLAVAAQAAAQDDRIVAQKQGKRTTVTRVKQNSPTVGMVTIERITCATKDFRNVAKTLGLSIK